MGESMKYSIADLSKIIKEKPDLREKLAHSFDKLSGDDQSLVRKAVIDSGLHDDPLVRATREFASFDTLKAAPEGIAKGKVSLEEVLGGKKD